MKRALITEMSTFRYQLLKNEGLMFLFTKSGILSFIIASENFSNFREANQFRILRFKRKGGDKFIAHEIKMKLINEAHHAAFFDIIAAKYPNDVVQLKFPTRAKFYNYLTVNEHFTEYGLSQLGITKEWSGGENEDDENVIKYLDCEIYFPSGMRESRKKAFLDIIKKLKVLFADKKLGKVISGTVRFAKINSKAIGLYYPQTKDIRIDAASLSKPEVLLIALIHEFGHKLQYEFNSSSEKTEWSAKYHELFKNPKQATKDPLLDIIHNVHVGQKIIYNGSKKIWKNRDWHVQTVAKHPDIKMKIIDKEGAGLMASFKQFVNSHFEFFGIDTKDKLNSVSFKTSSHSEDWFPTQYSRTSATEWFAELTVYYIQDRLKGEPLEFFRKFAHI